MELFARKTFSLRLFRPLISSSVFRVHFSTSGERDGNDDNAGNSQNELKHIHSYETIENPDSLVKTTIIKRRSILQQPRTPEQILEDAAKSVANRPSEDCQSHQSEKLLEMKKNKIETIICHSHDERKAIVGYDIFQELEERLEEILSIHENDVKLEKGNDKMEKSAIKNPDGKKTSNENN